MISPIPLDFVDVVQPECVHEWVEEDKREYIMTQLLHAYFRCAHCDRAIRVQVAWRE